MFLILIAIKIFINYNNIEQAIEQTAQESENKTMQLGFANNFELPYERSEYAQRFLKHENNMLLPWEIIIKLQDKTTMETTGSKWSWAQTIIKILNTPEESRQQFFKEKLSPPIK